MKRDDGKPRIGIFSLSSCEGCIVEILGVEERFFDILKLISIVESRVLGVSGGELEPLDIALVEGAVTRKEEEELLKRIRKRSRVLVALGDCACYGGRSLVKDYEVDRIKAELPGGLNEFRSDPIERYVKVDYKLYGCPVSKQEFLKLLKDLLLSRIFQQPAYNVCAECLLNGADCLLEKGELCLGPITRAGCKALCPSVGSPCIGCRGLSDDANVEAFIEILKMKGLEVPRYVYKLREFATTGANGRSE